MTFVHCLLRGKGEMRNFRRYFFRRCGVFHLYGDGIHAPSSGRCFISPSPRGAARAASPVLVPRTCFTSFLGRFPHSWNFVALFRPALISFYAKLLLREFPFSNAPFGGFYFLPPLTPGSPPDWDGRPRYKFNVPCIARNSMCHDM